jgi:hypothetical protein
MNWQAVALIFSAGTFYAGVRLLRRDVTGIRKVVNQNRKSERKRFTKLLTVLRTALPEEYREQIIEMLPEDDE